MEPMYFHPGNYQGKSLYFYELDYDLDNEWSLIYFVTLCAQSGEPIFDIPELRAILQEAWPALLKKFPHVTLDECIIMSNYMQCILWLDNARLDSPTLGEVIHAYQSLTTAAWLRHILAAGLKAHSHFWRGNHLEHLIDSNEELIMTRTYIRTNHTRRKFLG